ncbi:MAG: head-tail connector protein [Treponema sp.]|jgi:hypothetical protein|nr:head-tail connector protein [Treponema sp.]
MILKSGLKGRDKAEALSKALDVLKSQREDFHPDWERVQQFVSSSVLSFTNEEDPADKRYVMPRRITSRPSTFMDTLVSGVCGYSISPNIRWLKLGLEDPGLENQYGVKDWLEMVEGRLYKAYNDGNLYSQIPAFIESAATFGHGVMLIDEDLTDKKIRTATMNTREIYLDTDEYDEVATVFREFYMTWENAASYFGRDKLAEEVRRKWDDDNSAKKMMRLVHAVYRKKNDNGANISGRFRYASVYVDPDNSHIIQEGGYNDFPYAVFLWKRLMGKKYGIGPAMSAISDINLLHKFEEARLDAAQLSARPALNVPMGMKGTEEITPDGRNYYMRDEGMIVPVNVGANFPITLEITSEQETRIKECFHVDFFLMLQKMNLNQMTATAVVELQGEKAAVLSNMVSNLNGALHKIVQRSVDILFKQGALPELPYALRTNRTAMKVDFIGVLAQAQKKAHETSGLMQGLQIMGALAQMAQAVPGIQEAFDYVNASEILKKGFASGDMSELTIREDDEVKAIQQARARAQAQAAQQEREMMRQQELMRNYKNLNEPVNPDSPMGELDRSTGGGAV